MILITSSSYNSYFQFITVLVIFVAVLAITAVTTKYIAKYHKITKANSNIEIIESTYIANNKYIQLVKIGDTYIAMATCKDTVTMLAEIPKEQIKINASEKDQSFKDLLSDALKKDQKENKKSSDQFED